jgi:two-component system CheB/CheR fusion protein
VKLRRDSVVAPCPSPSFPNDDNRDSNPERSDLEGDRFPLVGIGASAGGLEAFSQLLQGLPDDTGMAFVLVQHLEASNASFLQRFSDE